MDHALACHVQVPERKQSVEENHFRDLIIC